MWTRPGYNYVLTTPERDGVFVWWRPKWEDGRPGTQRKDGLRVLECTIFRREGGPLKASEMIRAAVDALLWPDASDALKYSTMGKLEWLITGVGSEQTKQRRSNKSKPGKCFRCAGWREFKKKGGRADVWLRRRPPAIARSHTEASPGGE